MRNLSSRVTPAYRPPPPGSRLRRGWLEQLYEFVVRRTTLVAGVGVAITDRADGSRVIALSGAPGRAIDAVITAAPEEAPTAPAECVYDAQAVGRAGLRLTGVTPAYGRPTRNDEWMLWPARVGDRCRIVRERDAEGRATDRLEVMTEAIAKRRCGP